MTKRDLRAKIFTEILEYRDKIQELYGDAFWQESTKELEAESTLESIMTILFNYDKERNGR